MRIITIISFCLFSLTTVFAQKTITGTVSDDFSPLAYATVGIKGTVNGVVTDEQGRFTIQANKNDTLVISYVGYQTAYLKIKRKRNLDITLQNDILDEVVIMGYAEYYPKHPIICLAPPERSSNSPQEITGPNLDTIKTPIYPNPSSTGYFNLDLLESYDAVDISVVSITGQVVLSTSYSHPNNKISIDLSRFSTGIYIVNTIADGERLAAQKIIRG